MPDAKISQLLPQMTHLNDRNLSIQNAQKEREKTSSVLSKY